MTIDVRGRQPIDTASLGEWMDAQGLPGKGEPLEYTFVSGGSQNEIYEVRRGSLHCALRKPPQNPPPGRDQGILREWRVIEALEGTDVPHTQAIAVCDDTSILGSAFYLMGFVDGFSPIAVGEWPEPFLSDVDARRGLSFELINGLAKLSKLDWRAKGLSDFGRPDGFHERQVDRWMAFLDRVKTRELPGLEEAADWLRHHRPIDYIPGVMHGDYQFANVMFEHGAPATLAAIIDWEQATIGDPKLDLGWVLHVWPEDTTDVKGQGYIDLTGMPIRSELVDYFGKVSGRQVDDIDYYLILASWKHGIVLEQGYSRVVSGEADNERLLAFGDAVLGHIERAANLAASTDYSVSAAS